MRCHLSCGRPALNSRESPELVPVRPPRRRPDPWAFVHLQRCWATTSAETPTFTVSLEYVPTAVTTN
jgi:hypothetical protein